MMKTAENAAVGNNVKVSIPMLPERPAMPIRRLELGDITEQGSWLMPRLQKSFPSLDPRRISSWLTSMIYENSFMVLYKRDSVACAQLIRANILEPIPIVREVFFFVRDPADKDQIDDAMEFYDELERFTKLHDASTYIVSTRSDIPPELIGKRFKRVFENKQYFVRMD